MVASVLLLLASLIVLGATRGQARPMVVSMGVLVLAGVGYLVGTPEVARWKTEYSIGVLCLAVGYAAACVSWLGQPRSVAALAPDRGRMAVDFAFGKALLALVAAGSAYHFFKAGIVIGAADVETRRFEFLASGFFGIPSRFYLYGVPVMVAYAVGVKRLYPSARAATFLWRGSVGLLVITRLLSGFKGAVIEVVVILLITELAGRDVPLSKSAVRYGGLVIVGLIFAGVVASSYGTTENRMARTGADSVAEVILDRLTIDAARPGAIALGSRDAGRLGIEGSSIVNDLNHFWNTYAGGDDRSSFSLSERVAARVNGIPLSRTVFIVPTTVGLIPVLLFDFGVFGFIACGLVGALYRGIERSIVGATVITLAFGSLCLMVLDSLLMRGNFAYLLVNHFGFGALLLLGHPVLRWMVGDRFLKSGSKPGTYSGEIRSPSLP